MSNNIQSIELAPGFRHPADVLSEQLCQLYERFAREYQDQEYIPPKYKGSEKADADTRALAVDAFVRVLNEVILRDARKDDVLVERLRQLNKSFAWGFPDLKDKTTLMTAAYVRVLHDQIIGGVWDYPDGFAS